MCHPAEMKQQEMLSLQGTAWSTLRYPLLLLFRFKNVFQRRYFPSSSIELECPWAMKEQRRTECCLQASLCWGCGSTGSRLKLLLEMVAAGEGDQATESARITTHKLKAVVLLLSSNLNVNMEKSFQRGSLVGVTGTQPGFHSPKRIFV